MSIVAYQQNSVACASIKQQIIMIFDRIIMNVHNDIREDNTIDLLFYLIESCDHSIPIAESFNSIFRFCLKVMWSDEPNDQVADLIATLREGFVTG